MSSQLPSHFPCISFLRENDPSFKNWRRQMSIPKLSRNDSRFRNISTYKSIAYRTKRNIAPSYFGTIYKRHRHQTDSAEKIGKEKLNVDPLPSVDSTQILPLCNSTTDFDI